MDRAKLSILDSWVFIAVILLAGAAGLAVIFLQQKVVATRAFAANNKSVDQLIAALSDVEVRTGTVVNANEEASASLDRTENTEAKIASDLAKIDTRVEAIETKKLELEGKVDDTRSKLAQARKAVEENRGKVDGFEEAVKKRMESDEKVETEVEDGEDAMRTIDREMDTTRGILNGFDTNIDVIRVKVDDGERLLGQAEKEIASLDNEIKGANAFVEKLEQTTKETGENVTLLDNLRKRSNDRWGIVVVDTRKDQTFFDGLKESSTDDWVNKVRKRGYMESDRGNVSVLCWYYPRVTRKKQEDATNWTTSATTTSDDDQSVVLTTWIDVERELCDVFVGRAKVLDRTAKQVTTKKQSVAAALANLSYDDGRLNVYVLSSNGNVSIDQCNLDEVYGTKMDAVLIGLVKSTLTQREETAKQLKRENEPIYGTTNREDGPSWSNDTLLYISTARLDKFEYGDENKGVFDISFSAEWPFTRT